MKKVLVFIGGFVAGVLVTIFVAYIVIFVNKPNDGLLGLTIFEEVGECIDIDGQLVILEVIKPNMALAMDNNLFMVLLVNNEGKSYYDNLKINIPADKCARQIGIYQYKTKVSQSTVPAVEIK